MRGRVTTVLLCVLPAFELKANTYELFPPLARGVVFPDMTGEESLGIGICGIGDFNGDGLDDLAMGAAAYFPLRSSVYIVFGRRNFPKVFDLGSTSGVVRIFTDAPNFGTDVVPAGDIDRDGLADLYIFQVDDGSDPRVLNSRLYLLYGSRALPSEFNAAEIGQSIRGFVLTGHSLPVRSLVNPIASLKDFDGDGLSDLAFANSSFPGFQNTSGQVTILYGVSRLQGVQDVDAIVAAGGGVQIAGSVFSSKLFGFGDSIAAAGDVNQDGLTDLVVADPLYRDSLGIVRGRVHLIYGSRSFPPSVESDKLGSLGVTIENDQELHGSVPIVFGGGDLDGDGIPDFGFSVLEHSGVFVDRGRLLILRGSKNLPEFLPFSQVTTGGIGYEVRPTSLQMQRRFGSNVRVVPDEDGDGRSELFVASDQPLARAYVMAAGPQDKIDFPLHEYVTAGESGYYIEVGSRLASAGDPNGDGKPDYLLSALDFFADPNDKVKSAVFLLFGGFETDVLGLTAINPSVAPTGEALQARIVGTGFQGGLEVFFGAHRATGVKVLDPETLLVTTPVDMVPGSVDVKVVLPDAREAVLKGGFTFLESARHLVVSDLQSLVTFLAPEPLGGSGTEINPGALGDITGDGIQEYSLRAHDVANFPSPGAAYLVFGGTRWNGQVEEGSVAFQSQTVHFRDAKGDVPFLLGLGDLNGDRRADFAVARPLLRPNSRGEFAVLFEAPAAGSDVEFDQLRDDPDVPIYSSQMPLGYEVWGVGDFDGDGFRDIVTHASNAAPNLGPPAIVVVRGPFLPGEKLDLDNEPERVLWFFDSSQPEFFAEGVVAAGDLNGDGLGDIAFWGTPATSLLMILYGHAPASSRIDLAAEDRRNILVRLPFDLGFTGGVFLGAAGDVNADGFDDLLVHGFSVFDRQRGFAGLLLGKAEFGPDATWRGEVSAQGGFLIRGDHEVDSFGYGAATDSDLDGDGSLDLVASSVPIPEIAGLPFRPGRVTFIQGIASLRGEYNLASVARPSTLLEGGAPQDRFGATVVVLGDQDGDRLPEYLVEAPFWNFDGSGNTRGYTYLIRGASIFGPPQNPRFIRGDSNGDGLVNIADAIRILGALFLGTEPLSCEDSADVNDDGLLNVTDAIYLLGSLFLGGPPPPAPYPAPGADESPDGLSCTKP